MSEEVRFFVYARRKLDRVPTAEEIQGALYRLQMILLSYGDLVGVVQCSRGVYERACNNKLFRDGEHWTELDDQPPQVPPDLASILAEVELDKKYVIGSGIFTVADAFVVK